MRGSGAFLVLLAVSLWAAEVWQSKPFTEWSDKDLAKVVNSSPWAHEVRVAPSKPPVAAASSSSRRRGSGNAASDTSMSAEAGMHGAPDVADPASQLDRTAGHDPLNEMSQSVSLMVRWQSALPMKQAEMRAKYGPEVGASQQAKEFLAQEENVYVIGVYGLPAVQIGTEQMKKEALTQTTLTVKGKPALRPTRVDLNFEDNPAASNKLMDVYFVFPKSSPLTVADRDVELSTTVNSLAVRCVFHLKDMMFGGNLAL